MDKASTLKNRGLAWKMIRMVVVFVLTMGIIFMVVFAVHLSGILKMATDGEKRQLEIVSDNSGKSMTDITEENLKTLIKSAVERTEDEFITPRDDLIALKSMVEEVFKYPEAFERKEISPPKKENKDTPALQLLSSDGYENISPSTYEMMQRLANLEPIMREIATSVDYSVDCFISTPDGVTLSVDRNSDRKVDENGNVRTYKATERPWYKGAVEKGDVYFTAILSSELYGINEVVYSMPVYVDGRLVAVLEGSYEVDALADYMVGREIGGSGFAILVSSEGQLSLSTRKTGELKQTADTAKDVREVVNPELGKVIDKCLSGETGISRVHVDGEEYYAAYGFIPTSKWAQVIFVSVNEVMEPANDLLRGLEKNSQYILAGENAAFNVSVILATLAILGIIALSTHVVSKRAKKRAAPITLMTDQLREFSGVNMFFEMEDEYKTGDEIQVLAESFEAQAARMRDYVDEIVDEMSEKERVKAELSLATRIQADMLPNIFPAFPERDEFDIYASMTPAKEVGGDFYDFFFAGEEHFAMVMADVSGKGVPAAMFMMMAKSMIQGQIIAKRDAKAVLEDVNNLICSNNREKMFVTVWIGILDINTGVLTASNAGHEYPILKEPEGDFEIIKDKHGFVVGAKKNMKYTDYEITMRPGSKLFVYTDGVPEATDAAEKLFGMERTLDALNAVKEGSVEEILAGVDAHVRSFVGDAEQFDDLTMLCIEYRGPAGSGEDLISEEGKAGDASEITLEAKVESLDPVIEFIDGKLLSLDCPVTAKGQIDIAVDEIFGNIAHYAYGEGEKGMATVRFETLPGGREVIITFIDRGIPFNPLEAAKPDVTLPAKARKRGGLGIHLVRKSMDDVTYKFKDGQNMLAIRKKISQEP
ncbi:MAG: SpoIIE family protein phosphatase [Lachnospiraceae bacterium]|nr:SpoIIE family protein phosphatase [Lachnospiraceae bacterium]